MATINWNDGRLLTMTPGDTATIDGQLNSGQLYGFIFYNSAQHDTNANVTVVWKNSEPPVTINIPGTTGNQGLASVLFISGSDTSTASVSLLNPQPGAQIETYIASVKMPTNTKGINNGELPADGQPHPFKTFTRYFNVLASHWYNGVIQSTINQFTSIQFSESRATVYVVNQTMDPLLLVKAVGQATTQYKIQATDQTSLSWNTQGNGTQTVWVNAESVQNSQSASIALQSLSGLYESQRR
jgi:hypothetical protein